MNQSVERILLPLQRLQHEHDKVAHQDILSFDLHKRLKHMVLHFYKYAGKIQAANDSQDRVELRRALLDAFIICMASANALNLSLGTVISTEVESVDLDELSEVLAERVASENLYASAARDFLLIGGRMAKAVESADHMEDGNPRGDMTRLLPELTITVLAHLGHLGRGLEADIRTRLARVEQKSIFFC